VKNIERLIIPKATVFPKFDFERFSDEDNFKVATARAELDLADDTVKCLFEYRVFSGRLTYAEIGKILGTSETSLRMRMTRFNRRVKNRHAQLESIRRTEIRRPPISRMEPRPVKTS
jgi:hypothetical protein